MKHFVLHGRSLESHGFERPLQPSEAAVISKMLGVKLWYLPRHVKGFAVYYTTPKDAWGRASFQIHFSIPDRRFLESIQEFPHAVRDRIAYLYPNFSLTMCNVDQHEFQHSLSWYVKMSNGCRVIN